MWVEILTLPLTSYVALGKSLSLPCFIFKMGRMVASMVVRIQRGSDCKVLHSLACSEHSINVSSLTVGGGPLSLGCGAQGAKKVIGEEGKLELG